MSTDFVLGWLLGLVSSLATGIVMFWLEGWRDERREKVKQRHEDIRTASSWSHDGRRVSLRGFDLSGANLSGRDLSGADLEGANLEGTTLYATNFSNANLRGANFRKAKIRSAKFHHAALHGANFTLADIQGANFSEALLRRIDFSKVKRLEQCVWSDAGIDETTMFPGSVQREIEQQQRSHQNVHTLPSQTVERGTQEVGVSVEPTFDDRHQ